jgi:hypothetical protein
LFFIFIVSNGRCPIGDAAFRGYLKGCPVGAGALLGGLARGGARDPEFYVFDRHNFTRASATSAKGDGVET